MQLAHSPALAYQWSEGTAETQDSGLETSEKRWGLWEKMEIELHGLGYEPLRWAPGVLACSLWSAAVLTAS